MRRALTTLLALVAAWEIALPTAAADPILNGDFAQSGSPPPSWTTTFGDPPTASGGVALFVEGANLVEMDQSFLLPPGAKLLQFDFKITSTGGPTATPPDSFQAALYEAAGFTPLLPFDANVGPAFFSIDRPNTLFGDPSIVTTQGVANGFTRVTLNVSSLASQSVLLEFILNPSADGGQTSVTLDNVGVTVGAQQTVPEPGSLALLCGSVLLACGWRWREKGRCCRRAR